LGAQLKGIPINSIVHNWQEVVFSTYLKKSTSNMVSSPPLLSSSFFMVVLVETPAPLDWEDLFAIQKEPFSYPTLARLVWVQATKLNYWLSKLASVKHQSSIIASFSLRGAPTVSFNGQDSLPALLGILRISLKK
jgi:hypothetical protein